jgi:hypothetical protein
METAATSSALTAHEQIRQALAGYDTPRTYKPKRRDFEHRHLNLKRPKFKALVLSAVPSAAVRRVGGTFECFIGGEHVNCRGEHSTPDRAWLCLARVIASGAAS